MENSDAGQAEVEILQEDVDEDYEPTDKEIREYAEWLGIDADEDPTLLWIARRGLMTPLPKPWRPCQSGDGEIFYFNPDSGENTWDHPCDEELRSLYASERAKKASGAVGTDGGERDGDKQAESPPTSASASSEAPTPPRGQPPPPALPPPSGADVKVGEPPTSTGSSSKKLAPLGPLVPLPPLAPPRIGSTSGQWDSDSQHMGGSSDGPAALCNKPPKPATDLDDLFDMPLELEGAGLESAGPAPAESKRSARSSKPPLPTAPMTPRTSSEPKLAPLSPIDAGDPLSPIPASDGGDALSPIAATDESPSPGQMGTAQGNPVRNLSPTAASASSSCSAPTPVPTSAAVPPVPPSLQAAAASEIGSGAIDVEAAGVTARLCRELEQVRLEMATQASEHKAAQERERASSNASLSALTRDLTNEASEVRRLSVEKAAKDESLETLRAQSAAQLAAQVQVAAELDAALAAVKEELARARAEAAENIAAVDATRSQPQSAETSPKEAPMPPLQIQVPGEEDFLPSDALSPPTPELVSILVAELRPSASSSSKVSPSGLPGAPPGGCQDEISLWCQLEKDVNASTPSAAAPKEKAMEDSPVANAAVSSSLDLSSLSAVFLERSPEACLDPLSQACSPLGGPGDMASPGHDEWMKVLGQLPRGAAAISATQKPQRSHHPASEPTEDIARAGAKAAAATKASSGSLADLPHKMNGQAKLSEPSNDQICTVEELRSLRAELGELRAELRKERTTGVCASEAQVVQMPCKAAIGICGAGIPAQERKMVDAEVEVDLVGTLSPTAGREGFHACLESSNSCPTLKMQGRWSEPSQEQVTQVLAPAQGRTAPSTLTSLMPAVTEEQHHEPGPSARPLEATMEPIPESPTHEDSGGRNRLMRAAEERSLKVQREARDTRNRLENAEAELERVSWELRQWREDADDNDRLLRDTRMALHKEQASHVAAKAMVRESHREVQRLSSQLKGQDAESEVASAEVQRCRSELVDEEAEKQRLQLQLQARDAELGQLRHRHKVHTQLKDADFRTQRFALTEKEEVLGGRERYLEEREQLAGDAEAALRQQRQHLRSELQRAELAGLRTTLAELSAPLTPVTVEGLPPARGGVHLCAGGNGERFRSSSRRVATSLRGGQDAAWPICSSDESSLALPKVVSHGLNGEKMEFEGPTPSSSSATSPNGDLLPVTLPARAKQQVFDVSGKAGLRDTGCDALKASLSVAVAAAPHTSLTEGLSATHAATAAAAGELPEYLRGWRKDLRREHAGLEEDRHMWRVEARRVKRQSELHSAGKDGALSRSGEQEVLSEVRAALDARAARLNSCIGEYRALERLHSSAQGRRSSSSGHRTRSTGAPDGAASHAGSRRRASSTGAQAAGDFSGKSGNLIAPAKSGAHEEDLLQRWRYVLQPKQSSRSGGTVPPVSSRGILREGMMTASALRAGAGGA